MRLVFSICIIVALCILFPHPTAAQVQLNDSIFIELVPENPKPLEQIKAVVSAFSVDIDQTFITWTYDNKVLASGIGKKEVTLTAGPAGSAKTLTVSLLGNQETTASVTIQPGAIDLLWEAVDAYTPPFYRGKALLPIQGAVRVTAFPDGANPKNLSYTWGRNDRVSASGYGRLSFLFRNDYLHKTEKITVRTNTEKQAELTLTPSTPSIVAYEKRDGYVDYANGFLESATFPRGAAIVRIEPFYFSIPQNMETDLSFSFNIEERGDQENEVVVSGAATEAGSFSVFIEQASYTLQQVKRVFTLYF